MERKILSYWLKIFERPYKNHTRNKNGIWLHFTKQLDFFRCKIYGENNEKEKVSSRLDHQENVEKQIEINFIGDKMVHKKLW